MILFFSYNFFNLKKRTKLQIRKLKSKKTLKINSKKNWTTRIEQIKVTQPKKS
jgi:hypothetical protein